MHVCKVVFGAILLVSLFTGCASTDAALHQETSPMTPELAAIQSYDLAQWAKLQLQRSPDDRQRSMVFPGLQIYPLSEDLLKAIAQEQGGIEIVGRPESSPNPPYLPVVVDATQTQTFQLDIDEIRFNRAETLPYGFRINAILPFTLLPSTSARMSGVRVVAPTFARFSEADGIVPIEMALGKIDDC